MASSNERKRQLAREKHERQQSRRSEADRRQRRQQWIAGILVGSLILLTTGGFLLGKLLS